MTNNGKIIEINGQKAKIQIMRESACGGSCKSCEGCELKNHFIDADISTELNFMPSVGDEVLISMDDSLFLRYAVMGYAVFIIFLILGAVFGYTATHNEIAAILCAFLGLLIAFIIVKLLFKNKRTGVSVRLRQNNN